MSLKLAKLEAMVENLESLAGMSPQVEVVYQNNDGTFPAPATDAPVIIERTRFRSTDAQSVGSANGCNDSTRQVAREMQCS